MNQIRKSKINNFIVKPIKTEEDKRQVQGSFMFDKAYCTCFLLGKKESGKTILLWNIIQNRIAKNTTVVIFCSTVYADPTWIKIVDWLEDNDIPNIIHTGIYENGINALDELVTELEDEYKSKYDEERAKKEGKEIEEIQATCRRI